MLTGGARSGKSSAAQRLAASREADGVAVWVAVFGREGHDDPEFLSRIARHRADRPRTWKTLEAVATDGWLVTVPDDALLVVDCIGTLLGLAMEEAFEACLAEVDARVALRDADPDALPTGYEEAVRSRFRAATTAIRERAGDTVIVTNEVGGGVVPFHASGRLFRDLLGQENRTLVDVADAAYLCVAGRLIDLATLPTRAYWPED